MNVAKQNQKRIVIVGGGTAGWMTANLMAKSWSSEQVEIVLIESPAIGIIGVGEGSTPQLKGFMDYLGIAEHEWMPACNATYKNGIAFRGWGTKPDFSSYFHPFAAQPDDYTAPAFFYNSYVRRQGVDVYAHPDKFFLATYLAEHKLSPIAAENFPFEINYGYHFDSSLLGQFLAQKAVSMGVRHVQDKIVHVEMSVDGSIAALITEQGAPFKADMFVDCSGFSALLIEQQLKTPFISFRDNLFNDSAVVVQTPYTGNPESQTISTAMKNGWRWTIPLTTRAGNGYVFSSAYCSKDEAETEFRASLGLLDSELTCRHLSMKVGRLSEHWVKNCVAVGLSQGFIEPLEATALHLVQETVQSFIECYQDGQFTNQFCDKFNELINKRFEAIRDYIVAHYRVNSRTDTQYWKDNANNKNISVSLYNILKTWISGQNLSDELIRQDIDKYYPAMSWHCLLAGYGIYPPQEQLKAGNAEANKYDLKRIEQFISRSALNFQSHEKQLSLLREYRK